MSAAIDGMMAEHRTIERVLSALEVFAGRLERGQGGAAPADLGRFVTFLREYADELHHAKEERVLFEAMTRHGFPRQAGPIAVMLDEHEQGRALVGRLSELCAGAVSADERREVGQVARAFAALLRQHIAKEDGILYPMALDRLPPAALAEVDAACVAADADSTARARLTTLADELITTYRD
jgi:hemerythrin-like domain-containing protein